MNIIINININMNINIIINNQSITQHFINNHFQPVNEQVIS